MLKGSTTGCSPRQAAIVAAVFALIATVEGQPTSSVGAPGQTGQPASKRVTIPFLANATTPEALDFAAAECDLEANGQQMACRFRQVFLTISSLDETTCMITTNGFEQTFRREASARWVGASAPAGTCGIVETATLEDGGGTRWTLTLRTAATMRLDQPECRAASVEPEVYASVGVRRALPCTAIQPGAIER